MASSLCENCHKRPKSGTHRFCGKTCAAQAVAKSARPRHPQAKGGPRNARRQGGGVPAQKSVQPCTYCGQKPKFNGFDYCGKSCAALANAAQTKPPTAQGLTMAKQKTTQVSSGPANNASNQGPPPAKARKVPRTKAPVPQDDSTEENEETEDGEDGVSTDLDAYPSDSGSETEPDEPSVPALATSQSAAKSTSKGGNGTCAIPRCGLASHVDRNGARTKYCSTKHREEAVKLGLEVACIMCKKYPQSSLDYFCSSACRNQSMRKT